MAVRSRPFWVASIASGATATLYTVPTDRVALIRNLMVCNTGAAAQLFTVAVDIGAGFVTIWRRIIPADETVQLPEPIILSEGHALRVTNAAGASMRCSGFGSLLDGDPQ